MPWAAVLKGLAQEELYFNHESSTGTNIFRFTVLGIQCACLCHEYKVLFQNFYQDLPANTAKYCLQVYLSTITECFLLYMKMSAWRMLSICKTLDVLYNIQSLHPWHNSKKKTQYNLKITCTDLLAIPCKTGIGNKH